MDQKKVLVITDTEQGLMINGLLNFRNDLIEQDIPTEDVNELILRVIDAPVKRSLSREMER